MMKNISGLLLRYHRLKQNISQEGLCKGICVVSYVSKIEQGKVQPSPEIITALFDRLHITYHHDSAFLAMNEKALHKCIEGLYYGCRDIAFEESVIQRHEELLNSPLCAGYLLFLAYMRFREKKDIHKELEELSTLLPSFSDEQLFYYHYLMGCDHSASFEHCRFHLHEAGKYQNLCILDHALGLLYADIGDYSLSLDYQQSAYRKACDEGHIEVMKYASMHIANCYSNLQAESLMLKYYTQCSHICRFVNDRSLEGIIYYNIGSTYLQWKDYEQGETYLLKSYDLFDEMDQEMKFLLLQKLSLLYVENRQPDKGRLYLERMPTYLEQGDTDRYKLLAFIQLRYEPDYLQNKQYVEVLETICKGDDKKLFYGIRIFHMMYLVEAYRYHRRYKEAADLMVQMREFPINRIK